MTARERLALQAHRAGYGCDTLALLADLAMRLPPGAALTDRQLEVVCAAVEVCAQAGFTHTSIVVIAEHCRTSATEDEDWRHEFWARHALWLANCRYRNPAFYGISPCEKATPPPPHLPEDLLAFGRGDPLT